MSYILHTDSGQKFEVDGRTPAEVQLEIKNAGLVIGNVTLTRLMDGRLPSANGFELIESLSDAERQEQEEALEQAKVAEQASAVSGEVADTPASAPISADNTVADANANPTPAPEDAATVEDAPISAEEAAAAEAKADEVRRRLLGNSVAEALKEAENAKDDQAIAEAAAVFDKKAKDMTPTSSAEERKRRHTKREEMVEAARASQYGDVIKAIESEVVPGVFLSYVNPDMRWFQFPVTETADPANLHARTNTYVDVAPIVTGGWGFSLYVNGKSATKRTKIKENDAASLVKAINEWLPGAIAETKVAA